MSAFTWISECVSGKRPPVVAVVRLSGVIGGFGPLRRGLTLAKQATTLERAFKMKRVKAVALAINSPGGSPVQSALIARRIRALADDHSVPVLAFVEDVAASGGYWLATAADEIFADANSIVGSIGVVSAGFGFPEAIKRLGIERRVHVAGEHKASLDPFQPECAEDVTHLHGLQAEIHENFRRQVRERRGTRLNAPEEDLFNGRFWAGTTALDLGLIDGIGDAHSVLRERYGMDVKLRVIGDGRRWWQRRLGSSGARDASPWETGEKERIADGLIGAIGEWMLWSRYTS
ncbi:MAG: S49 family peptidase [Rhodospirillales bacterium]|nr:S49 family peptidase [Rhodospirillales bacterium]